MKKLKAPICLLAALAMAFGITACNTKKKDSHLEGLTPVEMQDGPSYTWDTSEFEIDWFVNVSYWKWPGDYGNDYLSDLLKRRTGAKINFIIPAGSANTQLMTMISSGDLPDIVTCDNNMRYKMASGNLLWAYDDLIKYYAPTMQATMDQIRDVYEWYREYDGKVYGIPNYACSENFKKEGEKLSPYMVGIIRSDFYTAIGRPEITGPDSFLDALERIRNEVKTYEGQAIIPLQLYEFTIYGCASMTALEDYFSVPFEDKNGKYQRYSEDYFQVFKFLNDAYNRGLLSVENFSDTREIICEKFGSGKVASFFGAIQDFTSYITTLYDSDHDARYESFAMNNYNGVEPHLRDISGFGYTTASVTLSAEKPDRCVRLIEYLLSDKGQVEMLFGAEDETQWTYDGNGCVQWVEGGNLWNAYSNQNAAQIKYYSLGFNLLTDYMRTRGLYAKAFDDRSNATQEYYIKKRMEPYTYNGKLALLKWDGNVEGSNKMTTSENKLTLFYGEMIPNIVMAKNEAEARKLYDEMIATAKSMGSDKVYEYCDGAFQNMKKMMGVKYAWPMNN